MNSFKDTVLLNVKYPSRNSYVAFKLSIWTKSYILF